MSFSKSGPFVSPEGDSFNEDFDRAYRLALNEDEAQVLVELVEFYSINGKEQTDEFKEFRRRVWTLVGDQNED